jgi:hypothetical protein
MSLLDPWFQRNPFGPPTSAQPPTPPPGTGPASSFPNCAAAIDSDTFLDVDLFNFAVGDVDLRADHRMFLRQHVDFFDKCADGGIRAVGHASNTGSRQFNRIYATARQDAVLRFLVEDLGVPETKIDRTFSFGDGPQGAPGVEDGRSRSVNLIATTDPELIPAATHLGGGPPGDEGAPSP